MDSQGELTDESNHNADGCTALGVDSAHYCDDELADNHSQGTVNDQWATTKSLYGPECQWRRADVDQCCD